MVLSVIVLISQGQTCRTCGAASAGADVEGGGGREKEGGRVCQAKSFPNLHKCHSRRLQLTFPGEYGGGVEGNAVVAMVVVMLV